MPRTMQVHAQAGWHEQCLILKAEMSLNYRKLNMHAVPNQSKFTNKIVKMLTKQSN